MFLVLCWFLQHFSVLSSSNFFTCVLVILYCYACIPCFLVFCISYRFLTCDYHGVHMCWPIPINFKQVVLWVQHILKDLEFFYHLTPIVFLCQILYLNIYSSPIIVVILYFAFLYFNLHTSLFKWLIPTFTGGIGIISLIISYFLL